MAGCGTARAVRPGAVPQVQWLDVWPVPFRGGTAVLWFQSPSLTARLTVAEPKMLRWTLGMLSPWSSTNGRRSIARVLNGWPTTAPLLHAYQRAAQLA